MTSGDPREPSVNDTLGDVTELLRALNRDEDGAEPALLNLVYAELRALAIGHLKTERSDHTLSATAVVNEAFVRLSSRMAHEWEDRSHFYAGLLRARRDSRELQPRALSRDRCEV